MFLILFQNKNSTCGITGMRPGTDLSFWKASLAFLSIILMVSSKNDLGVSLSMVGRAPWMRVLEPMILWLMHNRPLLTSSAKTLFLKDSKYKSIKYLG